MAWEEPDPIAGHGFEVCYRAAGFSARLVFDCHKDARKLEVVLAQPGFPTELIEHLKPFARPQVVSEGQLVLFDRNGYFRLTVIPGRLQAILRKDAPLSVIQQLIAQLERAFGGAPEDPGSCAASAIAISEDGGRMRVTIDDARCTRCLDCIVGGVAESHLPPATSPDEQEAAMGLTRIGTGR